MARTGILLRLSLVLSLAPSLVRADEPGAAVPVGVAVVDVTPSYPIRLMGYGNRKTESEGVASPLKVRALAIGERCRNGAGRGARRADHGRQLRRREPS